MFFIFIISNDWLILPERGRRGACQRRGKNLRKLIESSRARLRGRHFLTNIAGAACEMTLSMWPQREGSTRHGRGFHIEIERSRAHHGRACGADEGFGHAIVERRRKGGTARAPGAPALRRPRGPHQWLHDADGGRGSADFCVAGLVQICYPYITAAPTEWCH